MDVDDEEDEEEIARWSSVVPGEEKATEKSHNPEVEGRFLMAVMWRYRA